MAATYIRGLCSFAALLYMLCNEVESSEIPNTVYSYNMTAIRWATEVASSGYPDDPNSRIFSGRRWKWTWVITAENPDDSVLVEVLSLSGSSYRETSLMIVSAPYWPTLLVASEKEMENLSTTLMSQSGPNRMTLEFTAGPEPTHQFVHFSFRSVHRQSCIHALFAMSSPLNIVSPGYPHFYNKNLHCEWYIVNTDPTRILQLSFLSLNLAPACDDDTLTIYDEPNTTRSLCSKDNDQLPTFTSQHIIMHVVFRTSADGGNSSFVFQYRIVEQTAPGETVTTVSESRDAGLRNVSAEAQYLLLYFNDHLTWRTTLRTVDPDQRIYLTVMYVKLSTADRCKRDILTAYDGGSEKQRRIADVCETTKRLYSTGQYLTLVYSMRTEHATFVLNFRQLPKSNMYSCRVPQVVTVGYENDFLSSPGYPRSRGRYLNCVWILHGKPGTTIELVVHGTSIGSPSHCTDNYVEIRTGSVSQSSRFAVFCSKSVFQIPQQEVQVVFNTDGVLTNTGLSIRYRLRNGIYKASQHVANLTAVDDEIREINMPGYVSPGTSYSWRFFTFDIEKNIRIKVLRCCRAVPYTQILVYDGIDTNQTRRVRISEGDVFTSTGMFLFIVSNLYHHSVIALTYTRVPRPSPEFRTGHLLSILLPCIISIMLIIAGVCICRYVRRRRVRRRRRDSEGNNLNLRSTSVRPPQLEMFDDPPSYEDAVRSSVGDDNPPPYKSLVFSA